MLLAAPLAFAQSELDQTLERALQHLQAGDLATARAELSGAAAKYPSDARVYNFLGVIEAQQGNVRAAETDFKKAIAAAPRYRDAYLNLGRLYQERAGKEEDAAGQALRAYEDLLKVAPLDVEANYQAASLLVRAGSFAEARRRLARLPQAAQQRSQAVALACAIEAGLGNKDAAGEAARRLVESQDFSEADALSIAPSLAKSGRPEIAIRLLESAVQKGASPDALRALAALYESTGQFKPARETLEKIAQQQNVSVPLLLDLARVAYKQEDREAALGYLAHARDLDPRNAGVHFFFGMVCVELKLPLEAKPALKQAVTLDPENPYYNYAMGAVLLTGTPSESIPFFEKYVAARKNDPRGHFALGSAYFYTADHERARAELELAAQHPETAAGAHLFLGRIDSRTGQLPGAARELELALKSNPNLADAYAELASVYIKQRTYPEAEKALQRALGIDAENYMAHLNLLMLYRRTKDARAEAEAQRFAEIQKAGEERSKLLFRTIEIRPY